MYGYITSYPISLALDCSWDMELVEECRKHTAYEASADGAHVTFSPMADARHTAQKNGALMVSLLRTMQPLMN